MSSAAAQIRYTPEEYLALERAAEHKSEYLDGHIYAMAGGTRQHNAISANLVFVISLQLGDKPCQVYTSDMKVATGPRRMYAYPDVSVVCGEPEPRGDEEDVITNPVLIAEVLTPSTEAHDRGRKFFHYRQIETLQDYLLVAQDEARIEHYHRQAEGEWVLKTAMSLEGGIFLPFILATIRLLDVYKRIDFPLTETPG